MCTQYELVKNNCSLYSLDTRFVFEINYLKADILSICVLLFSL